MKYISIALPLSSLNSEEYPGSLGLYLPTKFLIVVPACNLPKVCIYPKSSSITFTVPLYCSSLYGSYVTYSSPSLFDLVLACVLLSVITVSL